MGEEDCVLPKLHHGCTQLGWESFGCYIIQAVAVENLSLEWTSCGFLVQ